jgi:hypothetical protein
LHGGSAGADDADALVAQLVQVAVAVAAGVVVVPAAGVERVALERVDARHARQLRPVQRAVGHAHVLGGEAVAAVGADLPHPVRGVPAQLGDAGLEQHVAVQVVVLGDAPAVGEDLRRLGVLLGGDVARLFEERKINVGFRIAGGARIAVPVPGAAEVAGLLDEPQVGDPGITQPRADQQPGEAAADHGDLDVVVDRVADDGLGIGVVQVLDELGNVDVLVVALRTQALVALLAVLPAQRVGIE